MTSLSSSSLLQNLPLTTDVSLESLESLSTLHRLQVATKPRRSWKQFIQRTEGRKVYTCTLSTCEKTFNHLSSLIKHERIHRGERPYVCKVCNQSFVQSSNLKRHEKIHTGEKTFECLYCTKKFSTTSNLRQHSQIHADEGHRDRHDCNQCGRSYLYPSSLNKHLKRCRNHTTCKVEKSSEEISHVSTEEPIVNDIATKVEENSEVQTASKGYSPFRSQASPKDFPSENFEPTSLKRVNYGLNPSLLASLNSNISSNLCRQPVYPPMNLQMLSNQQLLANMYMQRYQQPLNQMSQAIASLSQPNFNMSLADASLAYLQKQRFEQNLLQQQKRLMFEALQSQRPYYF